MFIKFKGMSDVYKRNRVCMVLLCIPFLFSCATYHHKMSGYYKQVVRTNQYQDALTALDNNNYIQQSRNKFLYFIEKGTVLHLAHDYDSSNYFFNLADAFLDINKRSGADVLKSLTINPSMQKYLGEPFDPFLIHYYKSLNYLYLNKIDDAIVEARRISLRNKALLDSYKNPKNVYATDAFAIMLQGLLYEVAADINNAFIAYRNAADIFLSAKSLYYGVAIPKQLKKDVIRTASQMGFFDIAQQYRSKFGFSDTTLVDNKSFAEAIIFIEQGWAPIKSEQNFVLSRDGYGNSDFYYFDPSGNRISVPFDNGFYRNMYGNSFSSKSVNVTRIALPYYVVQTDHTIVPTVLVNSSLYTTELAENINALALTTLQERQLTEIAHAIARQIAKKLIERASKEAATAIAKSTSDSKDEKKKQEDAEMAGIITSLAVNIFNTATEKADTRSWLTLPAYINYVRVPLQEGSNSIELQSGNEKKTISCVARVKQSVQVLHYRFK